MSESGYVPWNAPECANCGGMGCSQCHNTGYVDPQANDPEPDDDEMKGDL